MKKPTPKKKACHSQISARYHTFQNNARKVLMGRVDSMIKLSRLGKLEKAEKKSIASGKVTKIKA